MSAKPTIAQLLDEHVTLTLHSLDRIYLNGYVPRLQTVGGLMGYFLRERKKAIVSPALLGQMTRISTRRWRHLSRRRSQQRRQAQRVFGRGKHAPK